MRKMKKINGYLVVQFNDRERREHEGTALGNFGVIDAELYTGVLDIDRSVMEYDDAETLEVAVEQAQGLDAEGDFPDEPPRYIPERETFENLEAPLKNASTTRKVYALGELLKDNCPDNDCRVYLNIFRMAKETDAVLDELDASSHPAKVLQRDLWRRFSELRRMYLENYAIQQFREGVKK